MTGEWTPPPTCRMKVTGESGVMLHQRYYCGRRPAKGQDYCGQHLARSPWLRRREETS
jgi:hypothetical protein